MKSIKSNPEISIVVPVFNVEKFLKKCIESIISQSFSNFEVLLVNDGSTDGSLDICLQYTKIDDRVKVINKKNGGLSDARNAGIKYATGKYICFIDSDDFIEKEYLQKLYKNIVKYNSDVSMCEYFITDENGQKIQIEKFNNEKLKYISGKKLIESIYSRNPTISIVAWNKLYKRKLFANITYSKGRLYEDQFIAVPLFWSVKKVSLIDAPLYNYVQRKGSIMNSKINKKKIFDTVAYKKQRIYFFKNKDKELYFQSIEDYKNWIIEIISKYKISKDIKQNLQHDFRKYVTVSDCKNLKLFVKNVLGIINIDIVAKIHNYSIRTK